MCADKTMAVTSNGLVSMQVCVPAEATDDEVEAFANQANPTGIMLDC